MTAFAPPSAGPTGSFASPRGLAGFIPIAVLWLAAVEALAAWWHAAVPPQLPMILPLEATGPDESAPLATVVAISVLALALGRRKRTAWWFAALVFSAAIASELLAGRVAGVLVGAACLAALIVSRRRYLVESVPASAAELLLAVLAGAIVVTAATLLGLARAGLVVRFPLDVTDLVESLTTWLSFGDPRPFMTGAGAVAPVATVLAVSRLPEAVGLLGALRPAPPLRLPLELRNHATATVGRYGAGALRPFQLGGATERFTVPHRDGVVVFARAGRVAVVLGDPIGPDAWPVFDAFIDDCRGRDWIPGIYQASSAARVALERRGLRCATVGQEAVVEPATFDVHRPRLANLRHTIGRSRRGGVDVRWFANGIAAGDPLYARLAAVDDAWRQTHGPQLGFTIHGFGDSEIDRVMVAVALDAGGTAVAFATFRPTGADGGWVLDIVRRRPGSVPGVAEACVAEGIDRARSADVSYVSLGLAPLAGLSPTAGDPAERSLALAARAVRPLYDVSGLAFFKAKFDPRWEPRYLAVERNRDYVRLAVALLRLHLGTAPRGAAQPTRRMPA